MNALQRSASTHPHPLGSGWLHQSHFALTRWSLRKPVAPEGGQLQETVQELWQEGLDLVWANPAAARLWRAGRPQHLLGRSLEELIPFDDWNLAAFRELAKPGPVGMGRMLRLRSLPGDSLLARASIVPGFRKGQLVQIRLILSEVELGGRGPLLELLAREMAEGVLLLNPAGTILWANPSADALFGYESGSLQNQPLPELIPEEDLFGLTNPTVIAEALQKGGIWEGAVVRLSREGRRLPVYLRARCLQHPLYGVVHVHIYQDQRQEEDGRQRLHQLEQQVQQVQEAEILGSLTKALTLDLNNQLAVVQGNLGLLNHQADQLDPLAAMALRDTVAAARRCGEMVRGLQSSHLAPAGHPEVLNLAEFATQHLRLVQRVLTPAVRCRHRHRGTSLLVHVDPGILLQMMALIALHVRDTVRPGDEVVLHSQGTELLAEDCAGHPLRRPGQFALLSFSDNGCGMTQEELERLFHPYDPDAAVGQNLHVGQGLPLSMAHQLLQASEGWMEVESQPAKGTVIRLVLPLDPHAGVPSVEVDPSGVGPRLHPCGVLAVDDEPMILNMIQKCLQPRGFDFHPASDGLQAIQIFDSLADEIDLVFLDLIMPNIHGLTTWKELKRRKPQLRFVISTGFSNEGFEEVEPAKLTVFLPKPFTMQQLLHAIADVQAL
ncbi:MAG: response regulator [Planctomycetota bacterium]|nr:MAG: response regulator [Planctomycetota bacterium]